MKTHCALLNQPGLNAPRLFQIFSKMSSAMLWITENYKYASFLCVFRRRCPHVVVRDKLGSILWLAIDLEQPPSVLGAQPPSSRSKKLQ